MMDSNLKDNEKSIANYLRNECVMSRVVDMYNWSFHAPYGELDISNGLPGNDEIFFMDEFGYDGQFDEDASMLDIVRFAERGIHRGAFSTQHPYFKLKGDCCRSKTGYLESCIDPIEVGWIDVNKLAVFIANNLDAYKGEFGEEEFESVKCRCKYCGSPMRSSFKYCPGCARPNSD